MEDLIEPKVLDVRSNAVELGTKQDLAVVAEAIEAQALLVHMHVNPLLKLLAHYWQVGNEHVLVVT